jgi:hypothetical protein
MGARARASGRTESGRAHKERAWRQGHEAASCVRPWAHCASNAARAASVFAALVCVRSVSRVVALRWAATAEGAPSFDWVRLHGDERIRRDVEPLGELNG